MSSEQRSLYIVNQVTLAFLMLASVLGTLVLCVILFVVQFTIEGRRIRREKLASKARRLRRKDNGEEVDAPALEAGHKYHTFLSHVWGTGTTSTSALLTPRLRSLQVSARNLARGDTLVGASTSQDKTRCAS